MSPAIKDQIMGSKKLLSFNFKSTSIHEKIDHLPCPIGNSLN
jgi:hypothetical protein